MEFHINRACNIEHKVLGAYDLYLCYNAGFHSKQDEFLMGNDCDVKLTHKAVF